MRARIVVVSLGIALVAVLFLTLFPRGPQRVELALVNGNLHTMDEARPRAEAVAVAGGLVVGVGTTEEILQAFEPAHVVDLGGKTLVPGMIDAHTHVEGFGAALTTLDLTGAASVREVRRRLAERVRTAPAGRWIRGRGWDQTLWPGGRFPDHHDLDSVSLDFPVFLVRVDGHAAWLNRAALVATGITEATPDPPGGRIMRDAGGMPTGVLVDNAMDLVRAVLPAPSREERRETILRGMRELVRYGLTQVHDMGVDHEALDVYREISREGLLPLRVYVALDPDSTTWSQSGGGSPEIDTGAERLTVRAVKLYVDGALGSRGAALLEPYADDPQNRGLTLLSSEGLRRFCAEALDRGFQVCAHAIGDRANAMALDVYERVFRERSISGHDVRFRIEHAQVLSPNDIPRFARLGVLPSMQPTHCVSDMRWAGERLGSERELGAYAWRSLIEAGSIIPGGSDVPVESPDPMKGISAAVTRRDSLGYPPGGWHPEQRLTREEALKAFTVWAAYAAFQDGMAGVIRPGSWADFVVLSSDPLLCTEAEIESIVPELTMVGGTIEYATGPISPAIAAAPRRP